MGEDNVLRIVPVKLQTNEEIMAEKIAKECFEDFLEGVGDSTPLDAFYRGAYKAIKYCKGNPQ